MTTIVPYGDAALLVEPTGSDDERWSTAQALGRVLVAEPPPGFVDVVASFRHAFVTFDPVRTDHDTMAEAVRTRLARATTPRRRRTFTIPVVYGGDHGPDLDDVAAILDVTPQQVVDLHTREPWLLRFVASPVAAPFVELADVPAPVPRVPSPRVRIPPGSVAMSGRQSMIYPVGSPGGWRLVGRTPLQLFDLTDPDVVPYRAGDLLRFRAVDAEAWDDLLGQPATPDADA
ncbi:5-oxoprolinase subunit B family protein [Nocardioides euryhalodurans]|uniref:Carboxyltransferase domain-containing protein n=1 Tax=Nocardioides euryhalodurans TaxID=2518370 RepID=A0A4P7GNC1_9ACTN|nr:carboxyltransferase domain-containing protein [Nocardioides euryhalodurans]QBR93685.1 carboxyltransferase domain-containing protein [Nocardioides euryhalodurans]